MVRYRPVMSQSRKVDTVTHLRSVLLTIPTRRLTTSASDPEALTLTLTPAISMASCDDDFALLGGDEAQSQQAAAAAVAAVSFSSAAHRYATPIHSRGPHIVSPKKAVIGVGGGDEGYGEAFGHGEDCFAEDQPGSDNPFASQPHQLQDDDDDDGDDGGKSRPLAITAHHHHHHHHQLPQQHQAPSRPDPKRKHREDLSDDGESPSPYYNSSGGAKKSRPAAPSSSGDYRKDREEWSDSAIGCLLDAYTDKYVQLNRGNLRGRDWEDVATTVSERCNKQKSGKSVEQCKNKVDNLKKRYKVECQRLSGGTLPVSHWPWFKKMEQIVGSSSSSSTSKLATDDDKSPALAGPASAMRQTKRYPIAACGSGSLANNFNKKSMSNPRWKRVVLKISGAALTGTGPQNVDPKVIMLIASEVALAVRVGVEVAIVVGGRNFFCDETWVSATGTDRTTTYQIGMMASAMNSLLLQASLEKLGIETRVQTAFMMQEIAEPYIRRRAIRHLEKGRVVIFGKIGAGTGNPLFTTDTAAALRASEINADAVLKGISTDGVYECHSRNNSVAFEHISFREYVSRGFTAMDMTAITFCEENHIPVVLFNFLEPGNISRALCGEQVGTLIDPSGRIS